MKLQRYLLIYLLFTSLTFIFPLKSKGFDQPTDLVSYSVYEEETGWTQINATHDGYSITSDTDDLNGISSSDDFFPWYQLKDNIELDDFFNLNIEESNSSIILYIRGEGSENTISLQALPDETSTDTWAATVILVNSFLGKATGVDTEDAGYWPVSLRVNAIGNNPRQWEIDLLVQRSEDHLDVVYEFNASIFGFPEFDLLDFDEDDLIGANHKQSMKAIIAASGNSATIEFDPFAYVDDNQITLSPMSFIILLDNGAYLAIQDTSKGWIEVYGKSEIVDSWKLVLESPPMESNDSTTTDEDDQSNTNNSNLHFSLFIFFILTSILRFIRTIKKNHKKHKNEF